MQAGTPFWVTKINNLPHWQKKLPVTIFVWLFFNLFTYHCGSDCLYQNIHDILWWKVFFGLFYVFLLLLILIMFFYGTRFAFDIFHLVVKFRTGHLKKLDSFTQRERLNLASELMLWFWQNENGMIWNPGTVLPAGLMTFYTTTKPLDKSWHVMGLGYNPSISSDEIRNAAVVHFNGHMKPWLDVALNQYKHLWTKYVDSEMEFLPLCNFGL